MNGYTQRLVPYIISVLEDNEEKPRVRSESIRSLTTILDLIRSFPLSDARIFPEYIMPIMLQFVDNGTPSLLKVTLAECLPTVSQIIRVELIIVDFTLFNSYRFEI